MTYDSDVLEGHGTEIPRFAVELDGKNSRLKSLPHYNKELLSANGLALRETRRARQGMDRWEPPEGLTQSVKGIVVHLPGINIPLGGSPRCVGQDVPV